MILPWIQVDREAFERAAELAAILEISEAEAGWSIICLWRWALSRPSDSGLTGIVSGPTAVAQLEAGMRWKGDRGALVEALVEIGLLRRARTGDQFKIRGLDRYRQTLKRNATEAARRRAQRAAEKRIENTHPHDVRTTSFKRPHAEGDVDVIGAHDRFERSPASRPAIPSRDGLEERVES